MLKFVHEFVLCYVWKCPTAWNPTLNLNVATPSLSLTAGTTGFQMMHTGCLGLVYLQLPVLGAEVTAEDMNGVGGIG